MNVLLLVGKGKPACLPVVEYCQHRWPNTITHWCGRGEATPDELVLWEGELLISYLCPAIIPAGLLNRAKTAINFHPGSHEYPGTGCTNWALYDGATRYGVVAHYMLPQVDAGDIFAERRFNIYEWDTVPSLTFRAHQNLLTLFYDTMDYIEKIQTHFELLCGWDGVRHTRAQLDGLCRITHDMDQQEVKRRIRATYYPGMPQYGPYIELYGHKFTLHPPESS